MTLRFSDPLPVVPAGEKRILFSAYQILTEERVAPEAGPTEERAAIARWLTENSPSDALRRSIERVGYGDLLRDIA